MSVRQLDAPNLNFVVNGDFRVNQRNAATKAQSVGVYGYDMWKGHADGLEQVVEMDRIRPGYYTLRWAGGGNGSLNGGAVAASPITAYLDGTADVSVVVPDTADEVGLYPGTVAPAFRSRELWEEIVMCHQYYRNLDEIFNLVSGSSAANINFQLLSPEMRSAPDVTFTANAGTGANITATEKRVHQSGIHSQDTNVPTLRLDCSP